MTARVVALARDSEHQFSKKPMVELELLEGKGILGDAHCGETVKHRSRVAVDPSQPNLRQVHLIHAELFDELDAKGFDVRPSDLGENITTRGVDLLALPRGTVLRIGDASMEVTGLRNPCAQIDGFQKGLLGAVLSKDGDGKLIRRAGIMAIVTSGGIVRAGDEIAVDFPPKPYFPLDRV